MPFEGDLYPRLFEAAPDPTLVVDGQGRILLANPRTESVLGWPPEELAGRLIEDLVPGDRRPGHVEKRDGYLAAPTERALGQAMPVQALRRDGGLVDAEIALTPLIIEGVTRIIATIRDVSQRRRLEEQLRHAQKMDALGRMAGGIAHDFNNVLTALRFHLSFLREGLLDEVGEGHWAIQELDDSAAAVGRGGELTTQLLTMARQRAIRDRVVEADEVVRGLERMLVRVLGKQVSLEVSSGAPGLLVRIDPSELEQVLVNLAINARDAMPDGGRLSLTTRACPPTADEGGAAGNGDPGGAWEVEVVDDGAGMDAPVRVRAFDPFFTTKAEGRGTGLGLAMCYGIVRQAGGEIELESTPGAGTTVRVRLPRSAGARPAPERRRLTLEIPGGGETILFIEDDPGIRRAASRTLRRKGYQVLTAASVAEARQVWDEAYPIHLVLTDRTLPDGRGDDLACWMVAERPGLGVLVVSGYAQGPGTTSGNGRECEFPWLDKPYSAAELVGAVREVLDFIED